MPRRKKGAILPIEYDILAAGLDAQSAAGSFYGFALAQALAEGGHSLTSHGTLYKALSRMTEAGLLTAEWEDPSFAESAGRPRRRLYTVSGAGALALSRRADAPVTNAKTAQA